MKLVRQVMLTAVVPLVGVLLIGLWLLNGAVDRQREQVQHEDELLEQVVQGRLDTLLHHIEAASRILAQSSEAARAVESNDVQTLYALGQQYEPLQIDRIIYLDLEGRVLSRSDDRYRFGDQLGSDAVRLLLEGGVQAGERVAGLFRESDGLYHQIARPVLLYREIPIGLVVTFVKVTPQRLQELVLGTGADLELKVDSERFTSLLAENADSPGIRREIPMTVAGSGDGLPIQGARILLHQDRGMHSVDSLAGQFLLLFAGLLVVLPLLLMMILRRYLRPYTGLVDRLQLLSLGDSNLRELRTTLRSDFQRAPEEVRRVAGAVADMTQILELQMGELETLAVTDQLTGLKNRRFAESVLQTEMARIQRHGGQLSVLLVDLDEFKLINDRLGHAEGDAHLRRVASEFEKTCGHRDVIARWGGEEFLVLSTELVLEDALALAEKLRRLVDENRQPELKTIAAGGCVGTLSIGVAQWCPEESVEQLLNRTDRALYQAKARGRNRVEWSEATIQSTEIPSTD
ncbi:GGDEF domain-containing protein [Marinobacterium litorale]|uniref:GGDEF domain-containing protein n=1 Tax=Marinobacterium litorale TaxID=404770 RepID=UPI0003F61C6A|nr:diguanylate cyclase [Marinobacterium litorale]